MYVYILYSESISRYYIGFTNDVKERLRKHNSQHNGYTSKGQLWRIVKTYDVEDKSEAIQLEKKIKKRGAKRYIIENE
ncbi:MAG: GIY-YIG nuclease family protein [Chlorobiota bacterium]